MSRNKSLLLLIAIPFGAAVYWFWSNSRAATRSPRYTVVRTDGDIEIRDYPLLAVVAAPMSGGEMDSSFRKLFRYITGGNARSEKIAMTTPVLVASSTDARIMSFIMPGESASSSLPAPLDIAVSITEIPAGRFAVLRFAGNRSPASESAAITRLHHLLSPSGLVAASEPIFAYYDPPWTPVWLRRNEVMVRLQTP